MRDKRRRNEVLEYESDFGNCGGRRIWSESRSGDGSWAGASVLLRQQLLVISQLVDAHGRQLLVQLQLRLRQLGQIDHHEEVLQTKTNSKIRNKQ